MADLMPVNFPIPAEAGLINYSFTNIATGQGIVPFYSFASQSSGPTITYSNSTETFTSAPNYAEGQTPNGAFTLVKTVDFDNQPNVYATRLKGNAIVNITHGVGTTGATAGAESYVICYVKTVRGVTVTSLGSATSEAVLRSGTAAGSTQSTRNLSITLTDATLSPGDILRLTVELYSRTTAATEGKGFFCFDPLNQNLAVSTYIAVTAATNPTRLQWFIPFKVDL
jgi:hypothetical protein